MTRHEHLMIRAIEECNELAQRLSKALIFGMDQIQQDPGDKPEENPDRLTNRERIYQEYYDLRAVLGMCMIDAWRNDAQSADAERRKCEKVRRYLLRSKECGTLSDDPA